MQTLSSLKCGHHSYPSLGPPSEPLKSLKTGLFLNFTVGWGGGREQGPGLLLPREASSMLQKAQTAPFLLPLPLPRSPQLGTL